MSRRTAAKPQGAVMRQYVQRGSSSPAEELTKLADLQAQGLPIDAEYARLKAKALAGQHGSARGAARHVHDWEDAVVEPVTLTDDQDESQPIPAGMRYVHGKVVPHLTVEERVARGKAARREVPRSSHAGSRRAGTGRTRWRCWSSRP